MLKPAQVVPSLADSSSIYLGPDIGSPNRRMQQVDAETSCVIEIDEVLRFGDNDPVFRISRNMTRRMLRGSWSPALNNRTANSPWSESCAVLMESTADIQTNSASSAPTCMCIHPLHSDSPGEGSDFRTWGRSSWILAIIISAIEVCTLLVQLVHLGLSK